MAAKKFRLQTSEGEKSLQWGTWAMARFCELCGTKQPDGSLKPLPLAGLLNIYSSETFTIDHITKMIIASYESANEGSTLSDRQASELIDECGGFVNPDSQILTFIKFMNSETIPDITDDDGQKKS